MTAVDQLTSMYTSNGFCLHADRCVNMCRWEKVGPIFDGGHDLGAFDFKGVAAHQVIRDLDTRK